MLPGPLPTPVLAFSVRHLGAAYGLMVTASHNPRQDNGIKVYVRDGGQLLPPADAEIAAAIDAIDPLRLPAGWAEGPFEFAPADDAASAYVTAVAAGGRRAPGAPDSRSCTPRCTASVTPRCGRCLPRRAGRARCRSPPSGSPIPPSRPCPTPTRKRRACSTWPAATAEREGADLVLANDPDADRLAVMVPGPGGWRALTGDELGALLGDAVLARLAAAGRAARRPRSSPPRWSPARCCAASRRRPGCAASPR